MRKTLIVLALGTFMIVSCQSQVKKTGSSTSEEKIATPASTQTAEERSVLPTKTADAAPNFDGTIAFFSDMAGNPDIYVIQADGTGLTQLTDDLAFDDSPDLSPDSSRVVFLSARNDPDPQFPNFKYDIYLVNIDGTGLTQLTATDEAEDHPSWSPDGEWILFDADYDGDGFFEIYSMAVDGRDLIRLTEGPHNDQFGEWSPDGKTIAFASDRSGNWDIYLMQSDGTGQQALTDQSNWEVFPTWSPDGAWIAYVGLVPGSGNTDVFVMNTSGSYLFQVSNGSGFDENPTFSPDGKWIAYQAQMGGDFDIFVTAFHGDGETYEMFSFPSDELWPSWGH